VLRKVLDKKYTSAMCHGSRLICDTDVYNKQYNIIQKLNFASMGSVHSICSYDKQTVIMGLQ